MKIPSGILPAAALAAAALWAPLALGANTHLRRAESLERRPSG